jgi:hypothetical protein
MVASKRSQIVQIEIIVETQAGEISDEISIASETAKRAHACASTQTSDVPHTTTKRNTSATSRCRGTHANASFGVQVLLRHFGLQDCSFLDVDAAALKQVSCLERLLTSAKLGKTYDLLSGWLAT